jgi:hypothetical protein
VPNVKKIRGLNLPGTPWATSACCGRPLPLLKEKFLLNSLNLNQVKCMIASVRQMIKRDKVIGNSAEHTVVIEVNNCVFFTYQH